MNSIYHWEYNMKRNNHNIKQFGEVFTPRSLVKDMLDKLPTEVWFDKNKTWLEPSFGNGNFLIEIIRRLMISLKEQIPNQQLRHKHIIENMVFGVELQSRLVDEAIRRIGAGIHNHKLRQGNFLTGKWVNHPEVGPVWINK